MLFRFVLVAIGFRHYDFLKPDSESLHISQSGVTLPETFASHFGGTFLALIIFGYWVLIYYVWRSWKGLTAEKESRWMQVGAVMFIMLLVIAFCELQPLALHGMFNSANGRGGIFADFAAWLQSLAALLALFLALVAFFRPRIVLILKRVEKERGFEAVVLPSASRAAIYLAGAAIPFLLWMAYLYLAFAGIKDLDPDYVNWSGSYYHAPLWLADVSQSWFGYKAPIGWFYLVTGVEVFLFGYFVKWIHDRNLARMTRNDKSS